LRVERDVQQHVDYIYYNSVKHGLVKRASDWRYSSIHRYIKSGILDEHWGGDGMDFADDVGYK
jgi:putative transposase